MTDNSSDLIDRAKDAVEITRICHKDRDVLPLQLLRKHFELRRSRDQDHLRLQSNNSLETRVKRVANFSDCLCLGGKVTVTRPPDETIARADGKNNFRQVGC